MSIHAFSKCLSLFILLINLYHLMVAHSVSTDCGLEPTIDRHDVHCRYTSSLSLNSTVSSPTTDHTDQWQISYPPLTRSDGVEHHQFVFIRIAIPIDSVSLIEPLIRSSCDYEFEGDLSFKRSVSVDGNEMIYTLILPSCDTQTTSSSLCTYFIVMEASDQMVDAQTADSIQSVPPQRVHYELSARLGILLEFQQKYSYSTSTDSQTDDGDVDDSNDADYGLSLHHDAMGENAERVNVSCISEQFYGLKASITDFPIGIIIQPELVEADSSMTVTQFTSDPNPLFTSNKFRGFKGVLFEGLC